MGHHAWATWPRSRMQDMDRREMIYGIGGGLLSSVVSRGQSVAEVPGVSSTAVVPPGGNRYAYGSPIAAHLTPCKITSTDSHGTVSAFENLTAPRKGPPLHRHHREDEWFYVVTGRFLFEIDGQRTEFERGGSVFAPRESTHRWANTGTEDAILLVTLFPGGFEAFFDEMATALAKKGGLSGEERKAIYARHSMDLLGPPLFA